MNSFYNIAILLNCYKITHNVFGYLLHFIYFKITLDKIDHQLPHNGIRTTMTFRLAQYILIRVKCYRHIGFNHRSHTRNRINRAKNYIINVLFAVRMFPRQKKKRVRFDSVYRTRVWHYTSLFGPLINN